MRQCFSNVWAKTRGFYPRTCVEPRGALTSFGSAEIIEPGHEADSVLGLGISFEKGNFETVSDHNFKKKSQEHRRLSYTWCSECRYSFVAECTQMARRARYNVLLDIQPSPLRTKQIVRSQGSFFSGAFFSGAFFSAAFPLPEARKHGILPDLRLIL